jgi:hypothetical protein
MHVFHDAMPILEGDIILLIGHILKMFLSKAYKFHCLFPVSEQVDNSECLPRSELSHFPSLS